MLQLQNCFLIIKKHPPTPTLTHTNTHTPPRKSEFWGSIQASIKRVYMSSASYILSWQNCKLLIDSGEVLISKLSLSASDMDHKESIATQTVQETRS